MNRLLLSLGLLLVMASPSWAVIALVSGNNMAAEADAGGTTLAAGTFTNNITANNLIVAVCSWGSGAVTDATVTDSAGNTYTRTESGPTYDATEGVASTMYYAVITAGGGTKPSVTCNFWTTTAHSVTSSQAFRVAMAAEFSGAATSSVLDKHGTNLQTGNHSGSTDFYAAPSSVVLPDANGQLVVGFLSQDGGAPWGTANLTNGTGYTSLNKVVTVSPANFVYGFEYLVQTTATNVQGTWTSAIGSSTDAAMTLMATFRVVAAAGDQTFGYSRRRAQ